MSKTVTQKMKAALLKEPNNLQLEEIDVPKPGPSQVLVRVLYCGICHSDLHLIPGTPIMKYPCILGHEVVGEVVKLGNNVSTLKEGEIVGIFWVNKTCLQCSFCKSGRENLCKEILCTGYTAPGGYAQYTLAHENFAVKIPKGLDLAAAAPILCAGITTYKAIKETNARPGEWITFFGLGGLGHLGIQFAIAMGYRVIGVDIKDEVLQLAKDVGAEIVINSAKQDVIEEITKIGGSHAVVVCVPIPKVYTTAIYCVRTGGTLICIGIVPQFEVPGYVIINRNITIRGSIVGTRVEVEEAMEFFARGKVKTHYETVSFDSIPDSLKRLEKGNVTGRLIIKFDSSNSRL